MVIRCKYDDPQIIPELDVKLILEPMNPKSDIVWMDNDDWFKTPINVSDKSNDIPEEILSFISKWRKSAEEIANDNSKSYWSVKFAGSDVYYHGGKYRIDTGIISGACDSNIIQWVYEMIEKEIEEDMYSIGADYVKYQGMID